MRKVRDPDLREDIHEMRAAALEAIKPGLAALSAGSVKEFNAELKEFRLRYGTLVRTVRSLLWDAGPLSKHYLWPLVEEIM